jgi:autophagy-related protein 2
MRVTDDLQIVNDESIARLHILPLRCRLDQRALRFAQAFFAPDEDEEAAKHQWLRKLNLTEIPPPKLTWFKVKSCKMKVDYKPIKMNVDALREGCYVELINLSPLVDMVIVLKEVVIFELVGFGPVLREMLARWIEDICATQLYKFVTNASPFQPFSAVGEGAAEMFILPWQAYREGKGVGRAVRSGATAFAESVAYETLNTTAKLTELTGRALSSRGPVARPLTRLDEATSPLPSRPQGTPRGVRETTHHALESLARGVETANYKVVIVPYREYQRSGPTGAARSVVRGIPVAIMAPIGAASEALSYTLLGARNQVRPDIRREEEANERGLLHDS